MFNTITDLRFFQDELYALAIASEAGVRNVPRLLAVTSKPSLGKQVRRLVHLHV